MIDVRALGVVRDGTPILTDVTATFPPAGITALIGPNGAGKSTLLHTMAGLIAPDAGQITIDGADIIAMPPQTRARLVALLAQTDRVTARLTLRDLVGFGRWPIHRGRPGPRDSAAVDATLVLFDLAALADRQISTLSGGQRQRALIAMAHAQETPWLLLDEPLAALDPRHARDIMDRLHALSRPGPCMRRIVIVLHDLGVAARYADAVVAMKDGCVVAAGPCDHVMTDAVLSDLFDTGLAVRRIDGQPVVIAV